MELVPWILLARRIVHFDIKQFHEALLFFKSVLTDHPGSLAAPAAAYHQGVTRYKKDGEPDSLMEAYKRLQAEYPESEWAVKSMPYRLL